MSDSEVNVAVTERAWKEAEIWRKKKVVLKLMRNRDKMRGVKVC